MASKLPVPIEHRELTKKETEDLIARAFDLERLIKAAKAKAHAAWWELAEGLYHFHDLRGWTLLGHETLAEFLAQPDLGMSERSYYNAVRCWRDLVKVKGLPPSDLKKVEPSKVNLVIPAIMSGNVAPKKALADASALSFRDVAERYSPAKIIATQQLPDGSSPLAAETEPVRTKCPGCGQWTTEETLQALAVDGTGQETTDG
jgi:hypothetical protein